MEGLFTNIHAEAALPMEREKNAVIVYPLYITLKKNGKILRVFDSRTKHNEIFLNDVLLRGQDLNNTLVGVLTRSRKELFDIEQMLR